MDGRMRLDQLGPRICIIGPSGSGKSSLATAIADQRGWPAVHLDVLRHLPGTDWQLRPFDDFSALHDAAIRADQWVLDGNYSACLPQRLQRATGLILLDLPALGSLRRYLYRTWFDPSRRGGLDGGRDSVKWSMIRHILMVTPPNRRRYRELYEGLDLPKRLLRGRAQIDRFYRQEQLPRVFRGG